MQNRQFHLAEIKVRKSALNEFRQNLSAFIDDAHYTSHNADDIPRVESMNTHNDSSVTLISQRLNSPADSDKDLAEQDNLLIK